MRHQPHEHSGLQQAAERVQRELRAPKASCPRDIVVREIFLHIDRVRLDQALAGAQYEHGGAGCDERPGQRQRPVSAGYTRNMTKDGQ